MPSHHMRVIHACVGLEGHASRLALLAGLPLVVATETVAVPSDFGSLSGGMGEGEPGAHDPRQQSADRSADQSADQ